MIYFDKQVGNRKSYGKKKGSMKNLENNQFKQFKISEPVLEALTLLGYLEPTEIQKQVIPFALQGKDIVAKSQTGSGKTAAFGIPLCELTEWDENSPQALVLEPTRELAVQVQQELFYIGRRKRLKVPAVFGGFPIDKQIQTLKQKSHIVVGTPGRIMDHIRRQTIALDKIRFLVMDEADLMLDMGFLEEVKLIMKELPKEKSILLFSATLGEGIQNLIQGGMKDPISILLEESELETAQIEQFAYLVNSEQKYRHFVNVMIQEKPTDAMIFCGTREMVNVLYHKMKRDHIRCGMLHGELEQRERLKTIEEFREGRFHYLIATDVAARGVDFEKISHVFNYDFPTGKETYVHRIGRTGRNGESGKAISFVTSEEETMKRSVEAFVGIKLPFQVLPSPEKEAENQFFSKQSVILPLKAKKGAVFNRTIVRLMIGGGKKSKMRAGDIVGTICDIDTITAEDIGIIDIRDSLTYVEILNGKGKMVLEALQEKPIKGKIRRVKITRGN